MKKGRIILIFLGLLLIGGAVLLLLPVKQISFNGQTVYSESELKELIFGSEEPRYYWVRLKEMISSHRDIPFLARYDLSFGPDRSIQVYLYEKTLAGYIAFQNYYLYFDWDGVLVEIGSQRLAGLYEVKGLSVSHAVKGEKLPVSDGDILHSILSISQFLSSEKVNYPEGELLLGDLCEGIRFRSDGVLLEFGDIEVFLGDSDNIQSKLYVMEDILPELKGRRGILYLDSYRSGATHPSYVFKEK